MDDFDVTRRKLLGLMGAAGAAGFVPVAQLEPSPDPIPGPSGAWPDNWREIHVTKDRPHINLRELHDAMYPLPAAGDNVRLVVHSGVTIGPPVNERYAIVTGDWPKGVSIEINWQGTLAVRQA